MLAKTEKFPLEEVMSGESDGTLWVSLGFSSPLNAKDVLHVVCGNKRPGPEDPPEQDIYLERFDQSYSTPDGAEGIAVGARQIKLSLTRKGAHALAFRRRVVVFVRRGTRESAAREEVEMLGRPSGIILLAGAFLAAGLVGIAAFSAALVAWLTTAGTSPLQQLFALAWSCTFVAAAVLTWRRSRRAPPAFLAATGFLLILLSFLFPGGQLLLLPVLGVIFLFALLGHRYLRRASERTA